MRRSSDDSEARLCCSLADARDAMLEVAMLLEQMHCQLLRAAASSQERGEQALPQPAAEALAAVARLHGTGTALQQVGAARQPPRCAEVAAATCVEPPGLQPGGEAAPPLEAEISLEGLWEASAPKRPAQAPAPAAAAAVATPRPCDGQQQAANLLAPTAPGARGPDLLGARSRTASEEGKQQLQQQQQRQQQQQWEPHPRQASSSPRAGQAEASAAEGQAAQRGPAASGQLAAGQRPPRAAPAGREVQLSRMALAARALLPRRQPRRPAPSVDRAGAVAGGRVSKAGSQSPRRAAPKQPRRQQQQQQQQGAPAGHSAAAQPGQHPAGPRGTLQAPARPAGAGQGKWQHGAKGAAGGDDVAKPGSGVRSPAQPARLRSPLGGACGDGTGPRRSRVVISSSGSDNSCGGGSGFSSSGSDSSDGSGCQSRQARKLRAGWAQAKWRNSPGVLERACRLGFASRQALVGLAPAGKEASSARQLLLVPSRASPVCAPAGGGGGSSSDSS